LFLSIGLASKRCQPLTVSIKPASVQRYANVRVTMEQRLEKTKKKAFLANFITIQEWAT